MFLKVHFLVIQWELVCHWQLNQTRNQTNLCPDAECGWVVASLGFGQKIIKGINYRGNCYCHLVHHPSDADVVVDDFRRICICAVIGLMP